MNLKMVGAFFFLPGIWACPGMVPGVAEWRASSEEIYERGFSVDLRRHSGGGVGLFDRTLIENDAPGAGASRHGVTRDIVWGPFQARKVLPLEDARAERAFLVLFFHSLGEHPLEFSINGHPGRLEPWDRATCHLMYRWVEFPAEWLRTGDNIIDLSCPGAATEDQGWPLYLARADEFATGGGDPGPVGRTSFKSFDGGTTWIESPFGPDRTTRAEYGVRLSLDRYVPSGWIATPVIDLWRGADPDPILPIRAVQSVRIRIEADTPPETRITYYLRAGTRPGPYAEGWGAYEPIASGSSVDLTLEAGRLHSRGRREETRWIPDAERLNTRWIQIKAALSTAHPKVTPRLLSMSVTSDYSERTPRRKEQRALVDSLWVAEADNPEIRYSSLVWRWEPWDRPEYAVLRTRENLDGVVSGSRTQFDLISRLLAYATTRAPAASPHIDYPPWDALSILRRADRHGGLGFCQQFNALLTGLCAVYGIQGRLVNGVNHEMAEIWSDDFGRWVFAEASYANHFLLDPATGTPLNLLDLHRIYLDLFFPDRAIDWMQDMTQPRQLKSFLDERDGPPPVLRSSSSYHEPAREAFKGLVHAGFLRMMPRNNFYEQPYPRPLAQGTSWWPWDGYVNWYDERTPPKRQYSRFTDRPADLWPDLNRTRIHANRHLDNRYLYLTMETYTPNFSHFEIREHDGDWQRLAGDRHTWVLAPGRNVLLARAVNHAGATGKPARWVVHRRETSLPELY